tara:strand:+ start:70 stop:300 length:231 start_codon:yes stop_codon:yes gene_type:complete
MADSTLLKMMGLWVSQDKNGNDYFSAPYTHGTKILIYKNTYKKEGSNEPDYNVYISPNKKKVTENEAINLEEDVPF